MNDANQLLLEYARNGTETAFRELVTRYADLVYSAALRRLDGDRHRAEEVTQRVFTDLARKAATLPEKVMLGGWLHRHTGFVASNYVRTEIRRQAREKEAATMMIHEANEAGWQQMAPYLDEAIDRLESTDRDAILLRYFEKRDLRSLGAFLGISEDAAQKRVSRAVDKLRLLLEERGVFVPLTVLGAMLLTNAVTAAPLSIVSAAGDKALESLGTSASGFQLASGKLVVGALAMVLVFIVAWTSWRTSYPAGDPGPFRSGASSQSGGSGNLSGEDRTSVASPIPPIERASEAAEGPLLKLNIISKETGMPIPGVKVLVERTEGNKVVEDEQTVPGDGEVRIAGQRGKVALLKIKTQLSGFADSRLLWSPSLGDELPDAYTLMLERATPIGGRVLDHDGRPVPDALVGFGHGTNPKLQRVIETREFDWIQVKTDREGRWVIDRIAGEMLPYIYGRASHDVLIKTDLEYASEMTQLAEQLRLKTHVFRLGRSVTLRGLVVDPEGRPVEHARVFLGNLALKEGSPKAATAGDGSFEIHGCAPGRNLVTAMVEGYPPVTREVDLAGAVEPVRLQLGPGNTLSIRVERPDGSPVPKARAWLDCFDFGVPGIVRTQVDFTMVTGADGRAAWRSAPDEELKFLISAPGQMEQYVWLRPGKKEHVVVLMPALVIEGSVSDAETGDPVRDFRILSGYPMKSAGSAEHYRPRWSTLDRHWLRFSNGKFHHAFTEALFGEKTNAGYVFKFEAEGYASHVTGIVPADAGVLQMDVRLRRGRSHAVVVRLPDGRPAAGADVGLVSDSSKLRLGPAGYGDDPDYSALVRADRRGIVQVIQDGSVQRVVASRSEGYGEATMMALQNNPAVQLHPWSKVTGTFERAGKPVPGVPVFLDFKNGAARGAQLALDPYSCKTDEQGGFKFEKVPFGDLTVRFMLTNGVSAKRYFFSQDFTVVPGEPAHIKVMEGESPLAGR